MQQIPNRILAQDLTTHLTEQQTKVNAEISFADKAAKAKALWQAKNAAKFNEIYNILTQMSVGVRICNYCEANEADDIEHIYPKSFFPERAFSWENYLLACKSCNTQWKSDKCYIIDDCNTRILVRKEEPRVGSEIAFINPRIENPNDFLFYDTRTHFFVPIAWQSCENVEKAEKTLEILQLNARDTLRKSRELAFREFYDKLDRLKRALNAQTPDELAAIFYPDEEIFVDFDLPLSILKSNFKQSVQNYIQSSRHLSVWYAIKTYDKNTQKWQPIFNQIPEALNW